MAVLKCEICGKGPFKSEPGLKSHITQTHGHSSLVYTRVAQRSNAELVDQVCVSPATVNQVAVSTPGFTVIDVEQESDNVAQNNSFNTIDTLEALLDEANAFQEASPFITVDVYNEGQTLEVQHPINTHEGNTTPHPINTHEVNITPQFAPSDDGITRTPAQAAVSDEVNPPLYSSSINLEELHRVVEEQLLGQVPLKKCFPEKRNICDPKNHANPLPLLGYKAVRARHAPRPETEAPIVIPDMRQHYEKEPSEQLRGWAAPMRRLKNLVTDLKRTKLDLELIDKSFDTAPLVSPTLQVSGFPDFKQTEEITRALLPLARLFTSKVASDIALRHLQIQNCILEHLTEFATIAGEQAAMELLGSAQQSADERKLKKGTNSRFPHLYSSTDDYRWPEQWTLRRTTVYLPPKNGGSGHTKPPERHQQQKPVPAMVKQTVSKPLARQSRWNPQPQRPRAVQERPTAERPAPRPLMDCRTAQLPKPVYKQPFRTPHQSRMYHRPPYHGGYINPHIQQRYIRNPSHGWRRENNKRWYGEGTYAYNSFANGGRRTLWDPLNVTTSRWPRSHHPHQSYSPTYTSRWLGVQNPSAARTGGYRPNIGTHAAGWQLETRPWLWSRN